MRLPSSPQFRFLLRGSSLLVVMLALWWWLLLTPLLAGLRLAAELSLHLLPGGSIASITVDPESGWIVRVPIPQFIAKQDAVQQTFGRAPGAPMVKVRSFKLAIAETIPTFFTLSFPLFWALTLAAPRSRQFWRVLGIGSGLLAVLTVLSLLFYTAYSIETNMHLVAGSVAVILWNGLEYLNVNVVPYVAPILLGVWLHRELRAQIFSWDPIPEPEPVMVPREEAEKPRRGRYRGR